MPITTEVSPNSNGILDLIVFGGDKGQVDKAIADYRRALEIDPSDSSARDKLKALGAKP